MRTGKLKRALFKLKRQIRAKKDSLAFDGSKEVREVARLGQRLVIMELR